MPSSPSTLRLASTQSGLRYFLLERPLRGGDVVQLCCSGGWLTGRFEWDMGAEGGPRFFFSIELHGGGIEQHSLPIPEGALLRRPY